MSLKIVVLTRSQEKTNKLYQEFVGKNYFEIICQDIIDPIQYKGRIDYIFHFAGNASPYFIKTDPVGIMQSNLIGLFNLMELSRDKEPACLVFASTREVYGAVDAIKLSETKFGSLDSMDNRSCYPESKRACESILRSYYLQYGIKGISVRIAHCYGPGMKTEKDGRVMADFMDDAIHGRNIVLKSAGNAVRAFCYITDAIIGLIQVSLYGKIGEAYNLANESEPVSIRDLAQIICSAFPEHGMKVITGDDQQSVNDGYCNYSRVALDTSKIENIGFCPKIKLEEGINRTIKSFQN